jgi:hypothetical protein
MGPIAGLLIEYFVVGAVASLWLAPFLIHSHVILLKPDIPKEQSAIIAASLIPALYLVGMICDLLGYKLLRDRKKEIEINVRHSASVENFSAQKIHALAVSYEPNLAKQIELRSTRDRIARGSLVASIPMLWLSPFEDLGRMIATTISVAVIVILYQLWYRMQILSTKYDIQVLQILRMKYKDNIPSMTPKQS